MIISKILKRLKGYKIALINENSNVKIRENANTFVRIHKGSIQGDGTLYLNPNSVSFKETSKLRIDEGGGTDNQRYGLSFYRI